MDIKVKSIGFLVDELVTANIKCFMQQEIIMKSNDDQEILKAAKMAQKLNARRNQLIRAIDEVSGQLDITLTEKTYG